MTCIHLLDIYATDASRFFCSSCLWSILLYMACFVLSSLSALAVALLHCLALREVHSHQAYVVIAFVRSQRQQPVYETKGIFGAHTFPPDQEVCLDKF